MTEKEFFNKVTNSKSDILQDFVNLLKENNVKHCIIGGLAVNAYTEPLVTLDIDVVIASENLAKLMPELEKRYSVSRHEHSININSKESDIRIQIQTDKEHQSYLNNAVEKEVLGYRMPVASIEDLIKSKVIAYQDKERRPTKRDKDLLDIKRLVEVNKELAKLLPKELAQSIETPKIKRHFRM